MVDSVVFGDCVELCEGDRGVCGSCSGSCDGKCDGCGLCLLCLVEVCLLCVVVVEVVVVVVVEVVVLNLVIVLDGIFIDVSGVMCKCCCCGGCGCNWCDGEVSGSEVMVVVVCLVLENGVLCGECCLLCECCVGNEVVVGWLLC